jgi:hypothetical protein
MANKSKDFIFFPLLSIILVGAFAVGLGIIFMLLEHYGPSPKVGHDEVPLLIIILGMALVIFVPVIATLLEKRTQIK